MQISDPVHSDKKARQGANGLGRAGVLTRGAYLLTLSQDVITPR